MRLVINGLSVKTNLQGRVYLEGSAYLLLWNWKVSLDVHQSIFIIIELKWKQQKEYLAGHWIFLISNIEHVFVIADNFTN